MLTPDLLALAEEIAAYYRAPIGTTLAAMLPPGLESRLARRWEVLDPTDLPAGLADATDADGLVADATLMRFAPRRGREAWLERLRRSGALRSHWSLRAAEVNPRRVRVLRPLAGEAEPPRRAPVQRAILDALGGDERTMAELAAALDMEPSALLAPARRLGGTRPCGARLAHRRAQPARASRRASRPSSRAGRGAARGARCARRPAGRWGAPSAGRCRIRQDRPLPGRRRSRR